jgi:hypothetical protein
MVIAMFMVGYAYSYAYGYVFIFSSSILISCYVIDWIAYFVIKDFMFERKREIIYC